MSLTHPREEADKRAEEVLRLLPVREETLRMLPAREELLRLLPLSEEALRLLPVREEALPGMHVKHEEAAGSVAHTLPNPAQTTLPPSAHSSPRHCRPTLRCEPLLWLRELSETLRLEPREDDVLPTAHRMQEETVESITHTLPSPPQTASPPLAHSSPPHRLDVLAALRLLAEREEADPGTHCMQGLLAVWTHTLPSPPHTASPPMEHSFPWH